MSEPVPVPMERLLAHREWVRGLARHLSADQTRADDLEQEVWLQALRSPPREGGRLRGWLGRVLRSRAQDARRGEGRRQTHETGGIPREGEPSADEVVARAEAHRRVVDAVLALEEPYRTAVLLRFFEGLPPREVAARTGVPVDTVYTRLRRALDRLREDLDEGRRGGRERWLALLLPSTGGPEPAHELPWSVVGMGGLLMATKKTAAAVAALVLLLLGGYLALRPGEEGGGGGGPGGPVEVARQGRAATPPPTPPVAPAIPAKAVALVERPALPGAPGKPGAAPTDEGEVEEVEKPRRVVFYDIATGEPAVGLRLTMHASLKRQAPAVRSILTTDSEGGADVYDRCLNGLEPTDPDWALLTRTRAKEGWVARTIEVRGTVRAGAGAGELDMQRVSLQASMGCGAPAVAIQRHEGRWNDRWFASKAIHYLRPLEKPADDGSFSCRAPRVPELAIVAHCAGWESARVPIPDDAVGPVDVELVLERALPSVGVLVRDSEGNPVRNARVEAFVSVEMRPEEVKGYVARFGGGGAYTAGVGADHAFVNLLSTAFTGEDGTVKVPLRAAGEVILVVDPVGGHAHVAKPLGRVDAAMDGIRIDLPLLDTTRTVRFLDGGKPIAGARLTCAYLTLGKAQPVFLVGLDGEGRAPRGHFAAGQRYMVFLADSFMAQVDWRDDADDIEVTTLPNFSRLEPGVPGGRGGGAGGGSGGGAGGGGGSGKK